MPGKGRVGHAWQGACIAGGACVAGGHAWQGVMYDRGEGVHDGGMCSRCCDMGQNDTIGKNRIKSIFRLVK